MLEDISEKLLETQIPHAQVQQFDSIKKPKDHNKGSSEMNKYK
jgi:hypothetical protein